MADFKAKPEDIQRFLGIISQLESSGGKNLNHPMMESGIHAGDRAMGEHGLMPNTKQEMAKRYPSEIKSDQDAVDKLAEHVLNRAAGDETLAAGMWNQGHNTPSEKFDKIKESAYAQKYDKMRKTVPESLDPNPYYAEESPDFAAIRKMLQGK